MSVFIFIFIENNERERERDRQTVRGYIYISIYTYRIRHITHMNERANSNMHSNTGQQQECGRRSRGRHVSMSAFASLICSSVFTLIPAILPLYSSSSSSSR